MVFESTGRKEYCFGEGFSCHPSDPDGICYGSDGGIGNLTEAEREEVAKYMIAQWLEWLTITVETE